MWEDNLFTNPNCIHGSKCLLSPFFVLRFLRWTRIITVSSSDCFRMYSLVLTFLVSFCALSKTFLDHWFQMFMYYILFKDSEIGFCHPLLYVLFHWPLVIPWSFPLSVFGWRRCTFFVNSYFYQMINSCIWIFICFLKYLRLYISSDFLYFHNHSIHSISYILL